MWVEIGQQKQIYCDHEVARNKNDGRRGLTTNAGNWISQTQLTDGNDGLDQLRSHHAAAGDRYRVKVELCQLVTGYFDDCFVHTLSHQYVF